MVILVVQAVDDYGSTHDEDIVVPINPRSPSKKKTKKWMVACVLGLIAAVLVPSALLFGESTSVLRATTRTNEAFLLHRKDGTCVVQSGAWPYGTASYDDDGADHASGPYGTCFQLQGGVAQNYFCWSRSHINGDGDWDPCKPQGYGSDGWTIYADCDDTTGICLGEVVHDCGRPCTEFE